MNTMIISVFETEVKAFNALTAMKDLHEKGDISIYATAVINKNTSGKIQLKSVEEDGPVGTALGFFTGSLIGMLAGPVGLLVGGASGMLGGMFYDIDVEDVETTFVDEISTALEKGKTAIILEVDEEWTVPVNTKMKELGGIVYRRYSYESREDYLDREVESLMVESSELNEELKEADQEAKEMINHRIETNNKKIKTIRIAVENTLDSVRKENDAKVAKLDSQIEKAGNFKRKRLFKRKNKLEDSFMKIDKNLSLLDENLLELTY